MTMKQMLQVVVPNVRCSDAVKEFWNVEGSIFWLLDRSVDVRRRPSETIALLCGRVIWHFLRFAGNLLSVSLRQTSHAEYPACGKLQVRSSNCNRLSHVSLNILGIRPQIEP